MTASDVSRDFVVRTDGVWFIAPLGSTTPRRADLAEVLEVVRSAEAMPEGIGTGPGVDRTDDRLSPSSIVTPIHSFAGIAASGHVVIEAANGGLVLLDEADLEILDLLTGPISVEDLAAQAELVEPDDCLARLQRLADAGRLGVGGPERPIPLASDGQGDAPAPLASIPAPVPAGHDPADPSTEPRLLRATTRPGVIRALVRSTRQRLRRQPRQSSAPAQRPAAPHDGRIPVYAMWHTDVGPLLALGMLTATARSWDGGSLNERFEIRAPETAESVLADLENRRGPAVLLCSDYVWSLENNLRSARRALELCPDLFVVHGGPSAPRYDADKERFLRDNGDVAHVLARGEGEHVLVELLTAVADHLPDPPADVLATVDGITFVDRASGEVVTTPDHERIADLDSLPSPYLTGEFDHIPQSAWTFCLSIETTRGCPYGCTFCDWGSATMSRIRKFDLDRVGAELRWAAARGAHAIQITDANFGIMSRDIHTAELIVEAKEASGNEFVLSWSPAKSTTRHLTRIMDVLIGAGITVNSGLSLQTTDPDTLDALERSNIATDHFVALAADYRRRGFPLQGDLMMGLPQQTYDSYRRDLQFFLDHEIMARTWPVQILPNAPMNDPEYRKAHELRTDERNLVVSSRTFSSADRDRMFRFRNVDIIAERLGLLRHVMRYLQWDHGILATDLMERLLQVVDSEPGRFPILSWTFQNFDIHPTVAVGWRSFYREAHRFVLEEYPQVPDDSALECVVELQRFLMPGPGRTFPATITLAHDYVAYYRSATESLFTTGHAGLPSRRLSELPPAEFTVEGDPMGICVSGIQIYGDSRDQIVQGDFHVGGSVSNELDSPLMRILPAMGALGLGRVPVVVDEHAPRDDVEDPGELGVPVAFTPSRPSSGR